MLGEMGRKAQRYRRPRTLSDTRRCTARSLQRKAEQTEQNKARPAMMHRPLVGHATDHKGPVGSDRYPRDQQALDRIGIDERVDGRVGRGMMPVRTLWIVPVRTLPVSSVSPVSPVHVRALLILAIRWALRILRAIGALALWTPYMAAITRHASVGDDTTTPTSCHRHRTDALKHVP